MTHEKLFFKVIYTLRSIVWYNGHEDWLEAFAKQLENAKDGEYVNEQPLECLEWGNEEHVFWMLMVGMFGDWGTSIRSGWIEKPKEAAEFIRHYLLTETEGLEEFRGLWD